MSAKPTITGNDVVVLIGNTLNIDVTGKVTIFNILKKLSTVPNPDKFLDFIEERFNYERFRYLIGYQKFLALINEYNNENAPKLDEEMQTKALNKSEELFGKLTDLIDACNFQCQEQRKNLKHLDLEKTLLAHGFEKYQISIIRAIGSKETVMHLCLYGKEELMLRIKNIVNKKALVQQYPHLALEIEGIETIEKLKLGLKR